MTGQAGPPWRVHLVCHPDVYDQLVLALELTDRLGSCTVTSTRSVLPGVVVTVPQGWLPLDLQPPAREH